MIARLTGTLAELTADGAVIDVAGVGYLVQMSGRTLDALGGVGAEVMILTELQVREDQWTLFGFGSTRRARLVSRADQHPGGRRTARAGDPLGAVARRARRRGRQWRQGDDRPRQWRRPQARPAHHQRARRQARSLGARRRASRPRRGPPPRRTRCRPSPTSASSRSRRAPRSARQAPTSAPTRRSTRSSGWR